MDAADRLREALTASNPSDRLQAVLAAGTYPNDDYVAVLIDRCGVEPDFSVREMLTWALVRHPSSIAVPLLIAATGSPVGRARSQAFHTLSKIGDPSGWEAVTADALHDPDDDVACTAWRAAVVLVPEGGEHALAAELAAQLGRGPRATRMSLSRALATLGDAARPALVEAAAHDDPMIRTHAIATMRMIEDPDESFETAIFEAERIVAFGDPTQ